MKLKLLLLVAVGTVAAGAAVLVLVDVILGGVLQDPFYRLFSLVCRSIFGAGEEETAALYQTYVIANREIFLTLGMAVLTLGAFYLAMGHFTKWLQQIGAAIRQVVGESDKPIVLPKELRPLEEDLRAIQDHLREKEEAARVSEERRSELIAFLAHDLKTPLTSVVGYLTLLDERKELGREERERYTGVALDKARRLQELLGEFFDITRLDLNPEAAEMVPIQLSMLLEQLTDEFYPIFAQKDLECRAQIEHHLVVRGDPDKLARVFDNVLRNAVNYSTPGGTVEIWARQIGRRVEITITNEGLEIPEGELSNIFEKFYRLDAARSTRTGGAGLGLAIAKEIVERHGGEIRAESTGKRTSFTISLPAYIETQLQNRT